MLYHKENMSDDEEDGDCKTNTSGSSTAGKNKLLIHSLSICIVNENLLYLVYGANIWVSLSKSLVFSYRRVRLWR